MNLDIKIFNSIYFADQNLSKQDKSWNLSGMFKKRYFTMKLSLKINKKLIFL